MKKSIEKPRGWIPISCDIQSNGQILEMLYSIADIRKEENKRNLYSFPARPLVSKPPF